jgi:hypothetical protein
LTAFKDEAMCNAFLMLLFAFNDPVVLDTEYHEEFRFMPSRTMRHQIVWTVNDGSLTATEIAGMVVEIKRATGKQSKQLKVETFAVHSSPERVGTSTRYRTHIYCKDCNEYRWMTEDGDFRWRPVEDGFTVDVQASFFDSTDTTGKRATAVFILPGVIRSATGCDSRAGRVASISLTDKDWLEKGEKVKIAKVIPRIIHCGPSIVTEKEIAEFEQEYNQAKVVSDNAGSQKN